MKEIFINGTIYPGTLDWIQWQLQGREANEPVTIYINSPGGDVIEGLAIYNYLLSLVPRPTIKIIGMAGSIASVISCAGAPVMIAESAMMFIHNPIASELYYQNSDQLRKMADDMDKFGIPILTAYCKKTGLSDVEMQAVMDADTYLTPTEALDMKLVDKIFTPDIIENKHYMKLSAAIPQILSVLTINNKAAANAKTLINNGKVDLDTPWSFTAEDGDALLGDPPDWVEYGKWFLATDDTQTKETKAYYKYPFGKDGKVYYKALTAIRQRSAAQAATDVYDKAGTLIDLIDSKQKTHNRDNNLFNKDKEFKSMDLEAKISDLNTSIQEKDKIIAKLQLESKEKEVILNQTINNLTSDKAKLEAELKERQEAETKLQHGLMTAEETTFVDKLVAEAKIKASVKESTVAELVMLRSKGDQIQSPVNATETFYQYRRMQLDAQTPIVDRTALYDRKDLDSINKMDEKALKDTVAIFNKRGGK